MKHRHLESGSMASLSTDALAIAWLLDPQQSWVTGQTFGVDGGLSTLQPLPRRS